MAESLRPESLPAGVRPKVRPIALADVCAQLGEGGMPTDDRREPIFNHSTFSREVTARPLRTLP